VSITNGYCTLAELRARIGNFEAGVTTWDAQLEAIIEAASRFIDKDRRRVFYTTTEARYWTPQHGDRLWIDDAVTITAVEVAVNTDLSYTAWAATDYLTEPYNSADLPIMRIVIHPNSSRYFVPGLYKSAKITGTWGYGATVPSHIKQACISLSHHLWTMKDAPLGTAGFPGLGEMAANRSMIPADVITFLDMTPKRVAR
jgi:hypothetical protein